MRVRKGKTNEKNKKITAINRVKWAISDLKYKKQFKQKKKMIESKGISILII